MVGGAQEVLWQDPEGTIPEGLSEGEGTLAGRNSAVIVPPHPAIPAHQGGDLPQPPLVPQHLGEGFGVLQVREEPLVFSQCREHRA